MNIETFTRASMRVASPRQGVVARLHRRRWFLLFVGLPTLLATFYYGVIASDVYVSQSRFVIKAPGQKSMPSTTLANLIQTSGFVGGEQETKEILDYIRSRDALSDLQQQLNIRARYENAGADFLSRFPRPFREKSFENLFKYYQTMVQAGPDNELGMAVLEVKAFRAHDARDINARLLGLSENLVNKLNERAERRAVTEAEQRVLQAQARVRNARVALSGYRNRQEVIDPAKQATGVLEISNKLVSERAALQAQLQLMQRVAPANPAIPSLRARINALGSAIAEQDARVVGTSSGIASKVAGYENLLAEQEFAQATLTAASTSLEQARAEVQKQQYYLERVVEPNLPELGSASEPAEEHSRHLRRQHLSVFDRLDARQGHSRTLPRGLNVRALVAGWRIQSRVIRALMMRELITRFGRENIGFLWMMAEPLAFAVLVGIMWSYMKGPTEHGISVTAFVASGYIPLVMFRSTIGRAVRAFSANSSLLYHRQVTILDLIFVRFLVELIGSMMAYVAIAGILIFLGLFPVPADLGALLFGWFLYALFTLAVALILAPLSEVSDTLEKFMPVTTYLMVPFSGTFNMTSWLAPGIRDVLLYSPPVSAMELQRYGIWGNKITPYYDIAYSLSVSLVLMMIGLWLCQKIRKVIIVE